MSKKWINWEGGECPVAIGTLVDVKHRDGDIHKGCEAGGYSSYAEYWSYDDNLYSGDIVAYRLHKSAVTKKAKRIPVTAAKLFAHENGLSQVVIMALDDVGTQHIVTYGKSKKDCELAAIAGDNLKKHCGWPDSTLSKYSKVKS